MSAMAEAVVKPAFDVDAVRRDFPILSREVHGKPLVFLDSAASAQKPRQVMDAERYIYEHEYANVHRGIHYLSQICTDRMEAAREKVRAFLNAGKTAEIVFTRNATESINLVAASWGRKFLKAGDEIVITEMEHHANIIPWQFLRDELGVVLRIAPVTDEGELRMDAFAGLLNDRTKLVAVTHMSNVLGTITPVAEIVRLAHDAGARVLLDGAQAVSHIPVDVRTLDCDFYVFSGHKLYGPTGIGVLYGKEELLDAMPPYMGGGEMISSVTFEKAEWAALPYKFEAGTPAIAQSIGLGAAIDYVNGWGLDAIAAHEADVLNYATQRLSAIDGLKIVGTAPGKASVLSFTMDCAHPHDIGTLVDRAGVAVRVGHHCAQPLMDRLGVAATARASFAMYNTRAEVDILAESLEAVREFFG
jgi:cysteine desulfurase/selenocysteine lyase